MEDLKRIGAEQGQIDQIRARMKLTADLMDLFRSWRAGNNFQSRWERYSPEEQRALDLAYFVNESEFRAMITDAPNGSRTGFSDKADLLAERFTAEASEKLRRLRLHHQLALIEYSDTLQQVIELAYDGPRSETESRPERFG